MRLLVLVFLIVSVAASAQSNLPDAPHVYVEGSAEVTLAPDILRISGTIRSISMDAAEAERAVYEKSAILLKACKDNGILAEQISSSTVSMSPDYEYKSGRQELVGYELRRSFEITLTDLEKYYPALRAIVESGAVSSLDAKFSVADFEPLIVEAQRLAVEDARARAQRLAENAGMDLGNVYSITEFNLREEEQTFLHPHRFLFEGELGGGLEEIVVTASMSGFSGYTPTPLFEPSESAATATVFVVFLLKK